MSSFFGSTPAILITSVVRNFPKNVLTMRGQSTAMSVYTIIAIYKTIGKTKADKNQSSS